MIGRLIVFVGDDGWSWSADRYAICTEIQKIKDFDGKTYDWYYGKTTKNMEQVLLRNETQQSTRFRNGVLEWKMDGTEWPDGMRK